MATTLADAGAIVERRLNISPDLSSTPPTSAAIIDDLRDSFRYYFGTLQPIFQAAPTLNSTLVASLSGIGTVQHVVLNRVPLFRHEYNHASNSVKITGHAYGARSGTTVQIFYTKVTLIASDATEVDMDGCIHGGDWLEPICIVRATMLALVRMSMTSDSGNSMARAQMYRILEREREKMEAEMRNARDRDLGLLQQQLADRANFGKGTFAESGLADFEVDVRVPNRTSGQV